jgi:hypothetical protein
MIQHQGGALHRFDRPDCLTSFGRTTFFYDYGPFRSTVIGLIPKYLP